MSLETWFISIISVAVHNVIKVLSEFRRNVAQSGANDAYKTV